MKRVISMTLVLTMLVMLMSGTTFAVEKGELVISANSVAAEQGEWATITLVVEENPGFSGIQFYPVFQTEAKSWAWEASLAETELRDSFGDPFFTLTTAKNIVLDSTGGNCDGEGVLLEFRVQIPEDAALGEYTLSFGLIQCVAAVGEMAWEQISVSLPAVTITVTCAHKNTVDVAGKQPTCTEAGITDGVYCEDCGTYIVGHETIPANGHDYKRTVVEPTCTEDGYTSYVCSVCGDSYETDAVGMLGHADENKDHACDRCGTNMGEHIDANKDHKCDYGCSESIGEHKDTDGDGDHICDYCKSDEILTKCVDAAKDHTCDECGAKVGEHKDENKDHACDYGCKETIGEHKDTDGDGDHICDYCKSDEVLSQCVDAEKNHICDECGAKVGEHKDENKDHACDYGCAESIGEHADSSEDQDHVCDYGCGAVLEACSDVDGDGNHDCDVCGKEDITTHRYDDADCTKPATCVECGHSTGAELGHSFVNYVYNEDATCTADGTETAKCERCEETHTRTKEGSALGHTDESKDHACDRCEENVGEHADSADDNDHVCDYGCGAVLEDCSDVEGDGNHECDICGKANVSDHTYSDADCTTPATCTECGQTTGDPLGHDYETVVTEPTCTTAGYSTHTCSVCGHTYVDGRVSALGHTYEKVVTEPTCTTAGYATYTCSVCGDSYVDNRVGALGHSFVNYISNNDATCTSDGTETAKCERCDVTDTRVVSGSAKGHTYETTITAPTCTEGGNTAYRCTVCDYSYVGSLVPATGHDYQPAVTEPTCTTTGYTTWTCSACGDAYIANRTSVAEHDYQSQVTEPTCITTGYTTHTCSACGYSYIDSRVAVLGHNYETQVTAPTCTTAGYTTWTCSVCGDAYTGNEMAPRHSVEVVSYKAPTATEPGTTAGTVCSDCGEVLSGCETIAALGYTVRFIAPDGSLEVTSQTHSGTVTLPVASNVGNYRFIGWVEEAVAGSDEAPKHYEGGATITDAQDLVLYALYQYDPSSGVSTFSTNSASTNAKFTTVPTGGCYHATTKLVNENLLDCSSAGYTGDLICADPACNAVLVQGEEKVLEHKMNPATCDAPETCGVCGVTNGEALGHTNSDVFTENTVKSDCVNAGSYDAVIYCTVCHVQISRENVSVDALGHSYDNGIVTAPTCSSTGYTTKNCTVCGDVLVTNETAKLDHTSGEVVIENKVHATCDVAGSYDEATYCSVCHEELSRQTKSIEPSGHKEAAAVEENRVAAKCGEPGSYDLVVYCSVCGAKLNSQTIETPAMEHIPGQTKEENRVEAGCTTAGSYDLITYCSVCGKEMSRETKSIDSVGHSYKAVVTEATCSAAGYTTYTCTGCGDSYTADETPALEHIGAESVAENEVPATCTDDGSYEEVVYCAFCGAEMSRTSKVIRGGHQEADPVKENEVAPDHDNPGSYDLVVYCSRCGEELNRETVTQGAAGHTYESTVVAPTCTNAGYTLYTCSVCGDSYKDTFVAALGHKIKVMGGVAPTCTTSGLSAYSQCEVCNAIISGQMLIPALGHTEVVDAAVSATCTTAGITEGKHCSRCDAVLVAQTEIAALGHTEVVDAAVAATCTTAGLTEGKHCSTCNTVLVAQTEIAALGHTEVVDAAVAATCTTAGITEGKHCSTCNTVLVAQNAVAALGHNYGAFAVTKEATENAEGEQSATCATCGDVKIEKIAKLQLTDHITNADTQTKLEVADGSAAKIDAATELVVRQVKTGDAITEAAQNNLSATIDPSAEVLAVYDISLLLNGVAVQPGGQVQITIPVPADADQKAELIVVYVADDGSITACQTQRNADNTLTFVTDHFSYYAVVAVPTGSNIGLIIGILVVICLAAGAAYVFWRRRKL